MSSAEYEQGQVMQEGLLRIRTGTGKAGGAYSLIVIICKSEIINK